jgi:transposase InsO family protein
VPFQAWQDISVDYITPLPIYERNGLKYHHIAVVICRFTKIRYFIPTTGLIAAELADAFVARIYALHGAPDTIISDRGTQFISEFWKKLSARFSIISKHSSAYHPETNGQPERINVILEQYLRAYMNFRQNHWVDWLPLAEFALNNVVSETTGFFSFFANYGFNSKLGFEFRPPCSPDKTL